MRRTLQLVCAASLAVLAGCSGTPKFEAMAPAPGIEITPAEASDGPLSAEVAYSRDPIVGRYTRFAGDSPRPTRDSGEIQIFGDGDQWMIERYRVPANPDKQPVLERRVLLGEGGDGSVLLRESVGGDKGLTVVFDPPVRLAPPLMREGETIESAFTARIRDASGQREEPGTGTARVTYAGRQRVETPMGTFDANLVMTEFFFDFGLVKIDRRARMWIATIRPGRTAIVAEDIVERQTVFGFTTTHRTRMAIEKLVR